MALSDLTVYSEYAYKTLTELYAQEVDKFNAASNGCISLSAAANLGDFQNEASWQKISGLVRRRNAYGTGAVTAKKLVNIVDTMVKIAAGTPPIEINPSQFLWIQQSPEIAGATLGKQLAVDLMADMLNTSLAAAYAAMVQTTAILYDATADTPATLSPAALTKAAAKMGDRYGDIGAWVVHSTPIHNFWGNNISNSVNLFNYGTVNVMADPFGRRFIVTDSPSLLVATKYYTLGLVEGAIRIEQNNDYLDNVASLNGNDNITKTWQAEWSYNLGIKGYSWDATNGGKSPNDAAIVLSTNWDKYASSDKDGPGVILKTN